MIVCFGGDHIRFEAYPFSAASVCPEGAIPAARIREILPHAYPPEIRTVEGEVLFAEGVDAKALRAFAEQNDIPLVRRVDTWGLILEEFLDTALTSEEKEQTLRVLERCGISRLEAARIRRSVTDVMLAYNWTSLLWEWSHLNLYDVLRAYSGALTGDEFRLPAKEFEAFYREAMRIAEKGSLLGE
ncbi:hypothetical protein [Paenibacillus xanthanilyticus]|uniref:Uncharacterized protein n=1 Tax=Paenibacillus xanthanilyticus TaxID=1783531 RepID=A0ABV8JW10_9BACL